MSVPRPVVAAAIVDSLARPTMLLAAERSYPPKLAGFFELPGGKVEVGEDPSQALLREIAEELGTRVILGAPIPDPNGTDLFLTTDPLPHNTAHSRRQQSLGAPAYREESPLEVGNLLHTSSGSLQQDTLAFPLSPGFAPWPILQGRVMWVWLAEVAPDAPAPTPQGSHRQLLWVPLTEALDVPWLPTNHPIITNTLARIATSAT